MQQILPTSSRLHPSTSSPKHTSYELSHIRYAAWVLFPGQRQEAVIAVVVTRVRQPLCIQGSDALCPEVGRMLLTKQFEREPVIGQAKCPPSSRLVHVSLCSPYLICRADLVHFMDPFLSFNSMITKCRKQNVLCGRHWLLSSYAIRQNRLLVCQKHQSASGFTMSGCCFLQEEAKMFVRAAWSGLKTERRESLWGRFLSFWKPGEALRGSEPRLQQLHLQTLLS